jgi:2,4-dienoyl-CoA reductase (NADPH2)
MVSMARPFLADPEFVVKADQGRSDEINTCIACNQACLDHIFEGKICSCLVNPRACHETELNYLPAENKKKIAVVGSGPAGLSFSAIAAARGHRIILFERSDNLGGQLNIANQIPGKEEFNETIRYYKKQLDLHRVNIRRNTAATAKMLQTEGFDEVILATGVTPRTPDIEGLDHPCVLSYLDVLLHKKEVGQQVAIIGAGGVGFDVAVFITHGATPGGPDGNAYLKEWGVDKNYQLPGGLAAKGFKLQSSGRKVYLLQRKSSKIGGTLGKTTGWIHRLALKKRNVVMINGVTYNRIDDQGLHITVRDREKLLEADTVIVCAGQEPLRDLKVELESSSLPVHLIGGADKAVELDAKRAIEQGARLASTI